VVNAVALETQALLMELHRSAWRSAVAAAMERSQALGSMHSWDAARPLVQWSWSCP
jgi:precorrin-6Y C5,15-methyltransferase (decarboxylating)